MSAAVTLEMLAGKIVALETAVEALKKATPAVALPEADIDGQHGDPEVRKDPKSWKGESFVGKRYSECSIEYLRSMAGLLQWKAKKNDEEGKAKFADYDRRDASRALAWAARKEDEAARYGTTGHGGSAKHSAPEDPDDLPFLVNMTLARTDRA